MKIEMGKEEVKRRAEIRESAQQVNSWNRYGEGKSYKWLERIMWIIFGFTVGHYILTPLIIASF